jgi:hypothetical protein
VFLFALVASDSAFTIDLYPSREAAEDALDRVLADEPGFEELLSIEPLDFSGAVKTPARRGRQAAVGLELLPTPDSFN